MEPSAGGENVQAGGYLGNRNKGTEYFLYLILFYFF